MKNNELVFRSLPGNSRSSFRRGWATLLINFRLAPRIITWTLDWRLCPFESCHQFPIVARSRFLSVPWWAWSLTVRLLAFGKFIIAVLQMTDRHERVLELSLGGIQTIGLWIKWPRFHVTYFMCKCNGSHPFDGHEQKDAQLASTKSMVLSIVLCGTKVFRRFLRWRSTCLPKVSSRFLGWSRSSNNSVVALLVEGNVW
jgi:hypothetical protein